MRNNPNVDLVNMNAYDPRSDRRDLLAIEVESEIFTDKVRPSCCEQLQKIWKDYLNK